MPNTFKRISLHFLMTSATVTMMTALMLTPRALATPTNKSAESVQIEVVSTKTNYHGNAPNVFKYTDVLFARVNGKNLVYACVQRGDECPLMQNGKSYPAERVGGYIYISMDAPDSKKPMPIKFKETATW
jgi:hypothetical protein